MENGKSWALHSIMETTDSALELPAIEGKKIPCVRYFQVAVPLTCSQKHSKGYTMTISFYSTKCISSDRPEN